MNEILGAEDPLLDGLNQQQLQAVVSRERALLIVAGAGSGKTRVLTHRIAHLIRERDAWPSQILAITFTNKAASEMRERISALFGGEIEGMWVSTFHSACVRILRQESGELGLTSGFTIYDTADSRALLKKLLKENGSESHGLTPAGVGAKISSLKNELKGPKDYAASDAMSDPRERIFLLIFKRYEEELRRANALDFDDLIGHVVYLFRAFPAIAAKYQARFRYVLVDEYQDTNHAQYALIRELTRPVAAHLVQGLDLRARQDDYLPDGGLRGAALTVVGDSDQSIYAFRGADIRNIIGFEQDYENAQVVKLEQNYRSTQNILSAANAVISENIGRQAKNLWTAAGDGELIHGFVGYSQHDEARFVAENIVKQRDKGRNYGDIAVFYRTNSQTRVLEEAFMRAAIPYRVLGGTKFYERAEIKDMLAYLTSIINPYEPIAWSRLLGAPKRGIGPAAEGHLTALQERENISFHEAMLRADELPLGPKLRGTVRELGEMLVRCGQNAAGRLAENVPPASVESILSEILATTGYLVQLRAKNDPQELARAENVEELLAQVKEFDKQYPGAGLAAFLTEVALVAAVDDMDDSSGTVSLMTLHTAKGLEFPVVFLTGVEDGLLPHAMSIDEIGGIEEERRLFYVGITRAREVLYLTLAETRAQFGEIAPSLPSRFLENIPEELVDWGRSGGGVLGAPRGNAAVQLGSSGWQRGRSGGSGGGWDSRGAGSAGRSGGAGSGYGSGRGFSNTPSWAKKVIDSVYDGPAKDLGSNYSGFGGYGSGASDDEVFGPRKSRRRRPRDSDDSDFGPAIGGR
ncbi:MAG: 3'-5' exonuclease [Microbacteriaceae bacterium]|nr:3'-5' exonuclease [Microbacteriaceae bacterium]